MYCWDDLRRVDAGEQDTGGLAAEFEHDTSNPAGRLLHDLLADGAQTGEADLRDAGVECASLADDGSSPDTMLRTPAGTTSRARRPNSRVDSGASGDGARTTVAAGSECGPDLLRGGVAG
jgi:hypothetical protein